MKDYKVEKTMSERYYIRWDDDFKYAIITISQNGDFSVISDYGNFSSAWRSYGDDFKKFLIDICGKCKDSPTGYLYDKLHDYRKASNIDCGKTVKKFKEDLLNKYKEKRRDYWFMLEDAKKSYFDKIETKVRDAYDSLCSLENEGILSQDSFMSIVWNDKNLSDELFGEEYFIYADIHHTGDIQCEAFCREIAPVFAEVLREELMNEKN